MYTQLRRRQSGFTIVELLIVVVVIAILAAITIVAYNGVQTRAVAAALSSELQQSYKLLNNYKSTSSIDSYPASLDCSASPAANTICLKSSQGVTYQYTQNPSEKSLCLTGTKNTTSYYVGTDTALTKGACAGHNADGVVPVATNYFRNPQFTGANGPVNHSASSASIATYNGSAMARISSSGTADAIARMEPNSFRWTTASGQNVYASGTVYNASPGARTFTFGLRFYDITGASGVVVPPSTNATAHSIAAGNNYTFSVTGVVPAGATSVSVVATRLGDGGATAVAGDIFYIDNIYLSDSAGGFADGASSEWAWNGTAHDSTSTGPRKSL